MFNWNRKNPQGNSLDKFIDIYEVAQCRYKAFDVRREVICADGYEYKSDYKLLDTKPGIYILYSIKTDSNKNRVVHTYIGKADLRSNKRGILQRLEEHVKNDADKRQYHDKWDFALCITSDGTGEELFTPDVTKALEQWFIQLFKRLENNKDRINLINHNQKQESDGGSTQKDLDTHFNAIVELLAHVGILGVLSDGELGVNALAAKLETNKITVENIEKSIEKHKDQNNLREYSQEFIEDAVTSKIISNAFYDSAKRFKDCTVYKDSNRIYQTFELQNYLKSQTVLTPENIAKDMVDTLPENVFSGDKTFLLLYQKDFVFGKAILDRYLSLQISGENEAEKVKNLANFVRNRLFIATPSDSCYMESYKNFYKYYINKMTELDIAWQGDYTNLTLPNITLIDNYDNIVKNRMFSILEDKLKQAFRNIKHNSSGGNEEVKFDIVIGNPPYNNDLYIPFVEAGHKLSKEYTVMITPAKWQAKGGKANEDFRKNIVPYMSHIVYYPVATDVFDITSSGGITYFLIERDNQKYQNLDIVVLNKDCFYDTESVIIDLQNPRYTYYNTAIDNLAKRFKSGRCLSENMFSKKSEVNRDNEKYAQADKFEIKGTINIEKYSVISSHLLDDKRYQNCVGGYVLTPVKVSEKKEKLKQNTYELFSGQKEQCDQFKSYVDTKAVRFLIALGVCSSQVRNPETWRFVPDPGKFDHIFTDQELYEKYELSEEEIGLIERVIKERK